jgi:hypothetical protein
MVDPIANESKLLTITPERKEVSNRVRHEAAGFKLIFPRPPRENPGNEVRTIPRQTSLDFAAGIHEALTGSSAGAAGAPVSAR